MDYDKIEKQPTLPVVDFSEKPHGYDDKSKHFSEVPNARWPSELPPDAYKQPDQTRTDYIEDVATREVSNVEYEEEKEVPLTRRQKTARHFKRYWICYVLAGIVGLAIALPVL
jgi:hypothetical protein